MNLKNVMACMLLILSFYGCKDDSDKEEILTLKVSAKTIEQSVVPSHELTKHMIVTETKNNTILYLPVGRIHGFDYMEGYNYVILVKKTYEEQQVMDSDNIIYTLLDILSKEKDLESV
jgi:dTDP-4-dehydrorhamnose 3,5-epimerase-like enzyme